MIQRLGTDFKIHISSHLSISGIRTRSPSGSFLIVVTVWDNDRALLRASSVLFFNQCFWWHKGWQLWKNHGHNSKLKSIQKSRTRNVKKFNEHLNQFILTYFSFLYMHENTHWYHFKVSKSVFSNKKSKR